MRGLGASDGTAMKVALSLTWVLEGQDGLNLAIACSLRHPSTFQGRRHWMVKVERMEMGWGED